MKGQGNGLTGAEWNVMECLWEQAPRSGREVADRLAETVGWSRTTALTMLGRMEKKGYIHCDESDGVKRYTPRLARDDAARRETEAFLSRVYHGSVSTLLSAMTEQTALLSAMTEQTALTEAEVAELYAILDKAKEGRK